MHTRLGTRGRVVLATIILAIIVFIVSSPIAANAYELLFPPSQVTNISVVEKSKEFDIKWNKNPEQDITGYALSLNGGSAAKTDKDTTSYSFYQLDNATKYQLSISAIDQSGKQSAPFTAIIQPQDKTQTVILNVAQEVNSSRNIILISIGLGLILFILNLWVLFFKINKTTIFTIAAFPSFCFVPFMIFSLTLIASLNSFSNKLILSLGVLGAFAIGNYMLLLTSNILNGSIYNDLPLLQAGKAAQFIFSLISTYLILIYAFGSYQDFLIRIVISLPFIFFFSYSSIWMNKNVSSTQVLIRALVITLIMVLSLVVLSIWPIDSVYAILAASVIFYILLNIALEIRKNLNRAVWIEYGVLITLIVILLFANGTWGINGSII